jgi:hypothetical protein
VNAIILWNTTYLARTLNYVRGQGVVLTDELLSHVSPVKWDHIALTGDYLWSEIERPRERFRPLPTNRFDAASFPLRLAYNPSETPTHPLLGMTSGAWLNGVANRRLRSIA